MSQDITATVERLEAFEDRLGLRFEGLYARYDKDSQMVEVNGELHAGSGTTLSGSVKLVLSAYDAQGRVIATSTSYIDDENFFGFEIFQLTVFDVPNKPVKLRVMPAKA